MIFNISAAIMKFFVDKYSNDFKYNEPFVKISWEYWYVLLGICEKISVKITHYTYGITMFVLLMNGQPQALQQLPVSVVNLL